MKFGAFFGPVFWEILSIWMVPEAKVKKKVKLGGKTCKMGIFVWIVWSPRSIAAADWGLNACCPRCFFDWGSKWRSPGQLFKNAIFVISRADISF